MKGRDQGRNKGEEEKRRNAFSFFLYVGSFAWICYD